MEANGEGIRGPVQVEAVDLIKEVEPAALFYGEGVQKVDKFPVGEAVQVL